MVRVVAKTGQLGAKVPSLILAQLNRSNYRFIGVDRAPTSLSPKLLRYPKPVHSLGQHDEP